MHRRPTVKKPSSINGDFGCVVWLTGFSGAGKSTIAVRLKRELIKMNRRVCVLDGDCLRRGLCSDLSFSPQDRKENIRRVGEVAKLFVKADIICIVALISPYRIDRQLARSVIGKGRFVEIHVNAPVEICERRDPKGLYARARAGEIKNFTGISSRYEPPEKPDVELRTDKLTVAESIDKVLDYLRQKRLCL
jgi:adenylyl-sulfate kinase